MLPRLAILAGLGADWSERRGLASILRACILALRPADNLRRLLDRALTGLNEWTGSLTFLRRDLPRRLNPPLAAIDGELPPGAKILLVGQAAVFHVNHQILYNTVFNPETIELLAAGKTPKSSMPSSRSGASRTSTSTGRKSSRHRDPAGYGFTDFVTRERFADWVQARVLDRPVPIALEDHRARIAPSRSSTRFASLCLRRNDWFGFPISRHPSAAACHGLGVPKPPFPLFHLFATISPPGPGWTDRSRSTCKRKRHAHSLLQEAQG